MDVFNFVSDMDTTSTLWNTLVEEIRSRGIDSPAVFGQGNFGGYLIQQNAEEFASLICVMKQYGPFKNYLEIGAASGGNLRFIYENVGFGRVISFDDRGHSHSVFQDENSKEFSDKLTRFIGDSHSHEALLTLQKWVNGDKIDFAFIDGDHSSIGVLQDFDMVFPYLADNALVAFHDTIAVPSLGKSLEQISTLKPKAHFVSKYKPCGILVCELNKEG